LKIELLHFEGCSGSVETLDILERVIAEEGLEVEVVPVVLGAGERPDLPGSPTVLVDGEDLFPIERYDVHGTSCRIYATPEGPKDHPTEAMVREALVEQLSREQRARTKSR
jgi:hypothetical protein